MTRRRIRWSLAALGVAAWLNGCGGGGPANAITVWWAQWDPAVGLAELGAEFERETGIKVTVHQIPWSDYQNQVFLNFGNARTDFDIVVGDSQWIGRGATRGLYLDLTDWLPRAVDLSTIHPRALKYLCEYPAGSGKYFAAPCETDATGFAYRRDWFEDPAEQEAFRKRYGRELAIPGTWEQFLRIAEFFQRPEENRYGCVLLTGRGYDSLTMGFQQVMWAFGGSWGDRETFEVAGKVNSPESVAALEFFAKLLEQAPKGASNIDYGGSLEAFTNGTTAMAMNYFAFSPAIQDAMGEKAGFFPIPAKDGRRVVSLGGQGMSISTKTTPARQALAKRFIAWFLKEETQRKWITKPAGFTANTAILGSEEFRGATPYNAPFADSLDAVNDFWNVPVYNELLAASQQHVGEALDGVKPPKAALDALAAAHAKILRDAGPPKAP